MHATAISSTQTFFLHGRPFPHAKLQTNYNPTFPSPPYICKSFDRPELLQALKHGRPSTLFLPTPLARPLLICLRAALLRLPRADWQGIGRGDVRRHLTTTTSASPPSSPIPEARRRRTKTSELQLLLKNASDTRAAVHKLMAEAASPAVKKALSRCYDIYTSMVGGLNPVKGRFEKLDFQPIMAAMRSAEEAATECEGEFKKAGVQSPLTRRLGLRMRWQITDL